MDARNDFTTGFECIDFPDRHRRLGGGDDSSRAVEKNSGHGSAGMEVDAGVQPAGFRGHLDLLAGNQNDGSHVGLLAQPFGDAGYDYSGDYYPERALFQRRNLRCDPGVDRGRLDEIHHSGRVFVRFLGGAIQFGLFRDGGVCGQNRDSLHRSVDFEFLTQSD